MEVVVITLKQHIESCVNRCVGKHAKECAPGALKESIVRGRVDIHNGIVKKKKTSRTISEESYKFLKNYDKISDNYARKLNRERKKYKY